MSEEKWPLPAHMTMVELAVALFWGAVSWISLLAAPQSRGSGQAEWEAHCMPIPPTRCHHCPWTQPVGLTTPVRGVLATFRRPPKTRGDLCAVGEFSVPFHWILWMVSCSGIVLYPEPVAQSGPRLRAELWAAVWGDGCWDATEGNPGCHQGVHTKKGALIVLSGTASNECEEWSLLWKDSRSQSNRSARGPPSLCEWGWNITVAPIWVARQRRAAKKIFLWNTAENHSTCCPCQPSCRATLSMRPPIAWML